MMASLRNFVPDVTRMIRVENNRQFFFLVLRIINALLTYMFAAIYFSPSLSTVIAHKGFREVIAGLTFAILLDVAALKWDDIYRFSSESNGQRAIALTMSQYSMGGSAVVSFVQIIFMQQLIDLSFLHFGASLISVMGISFITVAHFINTMRWNGASPAMMQREIEANQHADMLNKVNDRAKEKLDEDANWVAEKLSEERRLRALKQLGVEVPTVKQETMNQQADSAMFQYLRELDKIHPVNPANHLQDIAPETMKEIVTQVASLMKKGTQEKKPQKK